MKLLNIVGWLVSVVAVLLTILFVGFKIAGVGKVADWSWWWVFSPAWIYLLWVAFWVLVGMLSYAWGNRRDKVKDPYRANELLRRFRAWRWKKTQEKYGLDK